MSVTFTATKFSGNCYMLVDDSPELNMANANAIHLLELLGYTGEDDYCGGGGEPEDILGRILIAQGLLSVATDDANGRPTVVDGNNIYFGTAPGYLADRLAILYDIAAWARERCLSVSWC